MALSENALRNTYFNSLATRIDKNLRIYEELSRLVTDSERCVDGSMTGGSTASLTRKQSGPSILSQQTATAADLKEMRNAIKRRQVMHRNALTKSIIDEGRAAYETGSSAHLTVAGSSSPMRAIHKPRPLPQHIEKFLSDEIKQTTTTADAADEVSYLLEDEAAEKKERLKHTLNRVAEIIDTAEVNGEVSTDPDIILAKFYHEDPYVSNVKLIMDSYNTKQTSTQKPQDQAHGSRKKTEQRVKSVEDRIADVISVRENQLVSIISSACSAPSVRNRQGGNVCSIDRDWKEFYNYQGASNFAKKPDFPISAPTVSSAKNEIMATALARGHATASKKSLWIAPLPHQPVSNSTQQPLCKHPEEAPPITEPLGSALDHGKKRAWRCLRRHEKALRDQLATPNSGLSDRIIKELTAEISEKSAENASLARNLISSGNLKSLTDIARSQNPMINSQLLKSRHSNRVAQLREDAEGGSDDSDLTIMNSAVMRGMPTDSSFSESAPAISLTESETPQLSSLQINSIHIHDRKRFAKQSISTGFKLHTKKMTKSIEMADDETLFDVVIPDNRYDAKNEFNFLSKDDINKYKKILIYIHNSELLEKLEQAKSMEDYEQHIKEYKDTTTRTASPPKQEDDFSSILRIIMPQDRMQTFAAYSALSSMDTASYKKEVVHRLLNVKKAITRSNLKSNDSKLNLYESAKAILQPLLQTRLAARKYPEDRVPLSTGRSEMRLQKCVQRKLWDAKEIEGM
ncbi:Hypothetical protein DHA2_153253 [Giardia duodenalis]|uniref:Uncharacterized protein n=1 Tax=Giardia intestinalis TaxID=5741 RepID=V6T9E5_GIAIN|nr:Hypothetical protein DHA2_153253 [Giardia intestinalis]